MERENAPGLSVEAGLLLPLIREMCKQCRSFRKELRLLARERRTERRWRIGTRLVMVAVPIIFGAVYLAVASGISLGPYNDVAGVVHIRGEMAGGTLASADKVIPALERAFKGGRVKHVLLAIDSPGGSPVEAERIGNAIDLLRKRYNKPVTAVISNIGASAAYMTAMHADRIVAGKYSLVGSIGAILAPWQFDQAIAQLRVSQRVYASGELKSFLNPFTPVSEQADAKAKQLVRDVGDIFIGELKQHRGRHLKHGVDYGSGEVWNGIQAKELGLVDAVGTIETESHRLGGLDLFQFGPANTGIAGLGAEFMESLQALLASPALREGMSLR